MVSSSRDFYVCVDYLMSIFGILPELSLQLSSYHYHLSCILMMQLVFVSLAVSCKVIGALLSFIVILEN